MYSQKKGHLQQRSKGCITKPFKNKCIVVISEVTEWHLDGADPTALRKKSVIFALSSLGAAVIFCSKCILLCRSIKHHTRSPPWCTHSTKTPARNLQLRSCVYFNSQHCTESLRTFKCLPSCFSFAIGVRTHYCFISLHEKAPNRFHTDLQFSQQLCTK